MTNPNLTHIIAVLDRSGSMSNKVEDTCGGFDSFIAEQRTIEGQTTYVTLAQFDDQYEMPYTALHIDDVPALRLEPRGSTALHDAIGKTIRLTGDRLRRLPEDERPGSVVFIILTDGHENSSREFNLHQIKAMIEEHQGKYSWLFKFFGADITALKVASSMGVANDHAMYYAPANSGIAFRSASRSTANYVSAVAGGQSYAVASASAAFTEEERDAAANPAPAVFNATGAPSTKTKSRSTAVSK